jgi:hypothetical protein
MPFGGAWVLMLELAASTGSVGGLLEAVGCTRAPRPQPQSPIRESSQGFGSTFLSTGARQGDAGRLDIHAAFIHKSAIHSPRKVQ